MLNLVLFTALSFLAYLLLIFIYVYSQAILGIWSGVRVERVAIGFDIFDKYIVSWHGRQWEWRIGILPTGGYTKFKGIDDQPISFGASNDEEGVACRDHCPPSPPADSMEAVGPLAKICIVLVGPLCQIATAIVLLAIPVWQQTAQLQYEIGGIAGFTPSAVPGLKTTENAATWEGQWMLCSTIAAEAFNRFVLFQPLDGWSGFCGWMATCGAAGTNSLTLWATLIGIVAFLTGTFNLLPLGGMNGSHVIRFLFQTVVDSKTVDKWFGRFTLITLPLVLASFVRLIYADVMWLWTR